MTTVAPLRLQLGVAAPVGGGGVGTPQLQIDGVFATTTKSLDSKFLYTPGNENPAVSTSDYYHMHACQFLRPYDLDTMGSPGAAVKAANGGNRYYWIFTSDHPEGGTGIQRDSAGFKAGFSNDPGTPPTLVQGVIPSTNSFDGADIPNATGYTGFFSDFAPSTLVYNPDDASFPFYLYTQGQPAGSGIFTSLGTQSLMWKSSDLLDWRPGAWAHRTTDDAKIVHPNSLTSHQHVIRLGTGNWVSFGSVGETNAMGAGKWASTDGLAFQVVGSTIFNATGHTATNFTINSGSGTPNRLTASSAVFSSGDTGKAITIFDASGDVIAGGRFNPRTITFVDSTHVDLSGGNPGITLSSASVAVEIVTNSVRTAPALAPIGGTSTYYPGIVGCTFAISGQTYQLMVEDARHSGQPEDDGQYVTVVAVDSNFNISQSIPVIRLGHYAGIYTGMEYLQGACGIYEDGILHAFAEVGYPGPHGTYAAPQVSARTAGSISGTTMTLTAVAGFVSLGAMVYTTLDGFIGQVTGLGTGTGGTGTYTIENSLSITVTAGSYIRINGGTDYNTEDSSDSGGFRQQFIAYYTMAFESTTASRAAPFGVAISCSNNTVTISWLTTPLGTGAESQGYNIYRGTTSGTQATALSGNTYSGTSATDTPTPGQQYWYKVVKVSGGVEQTTKFRVVHMYVG